MKQKAADILKKYREQILYLVFGALTTVVSIGSYALFNAVFGINELIANVISWILAVLFAYVTNRRWVFCSSAKTKKEILTEMASFFAGRLATLGMEELILFVFITCLGLNSIAVKIIAQVIVLVSNYVISKLLVFRKRK